MKDFQGKRKSVFYVAFFEEDNTFEVVKGEDCRHVDEGEEYLEANFDNKWVEGNIWKKC
jgi:hypothetical protein